MCHVPPIQPLQQWEVVEEVGGVVAQGAEGVGPMGGVREGQLLQAREGEEGGHVLKGGRNVCMHHHFYEQRATAQRGLAQVQLRGCS